MKIMSRAISGCRGFRFFIRLPLLHANHLPVTREIDDTSDPGPFPAASLVVPFDVMLDDDAEDAMVGDQ